MPSYPNTTANPIEIVAWPARTDTGEGIKKIYRLSGIGQFLKKFYEKKRATVLYSTRFLDTISSARVCHWRCVGTPAMTTIRKRFQGDV